MLRSDQVSPRSAVRRRTAVIVLLSTAGGASAGCISSESCEAVLCGMLPPAVTATIRDASDGGIVCGAVVNDFPFDCAAARPVQLSDGGYPYRAGPVPLTVSAPGYVTQSRTVDVPARADDSCCPLLYEPQQVDVALVPL